MALSPFESNISKGADRTKDAAPHPLLAEFLHEGDKAQAALIGGRIARPEPPKELDFSKDDPYKSLKLEAIKSPAETNLNHQLEFSNVAQLDQSAQQRLDTNKDHDELSWSSKTLSFQQIAQSADARLFANA